MKKSTRNTVNLIISSFLVIGYVICSYFFSTLASQMTDIWGNLVQVLIFIVFGLLLFYATRVGEGKQVHRFSLAVLLLVVLPSLCIVGISFIPYLNIAGMDTETGIGKVLYDVNAQPIIMILAGVALGYGIPYTFISGYELKEYSEDEADAEEEEIVEELLEGGLAEELAEAEAEIEAAEADVEAEILKEEIEE